MATLYHWHSPLRPGSLHLNALGYTFRPDLTDGMEGFSGPDFRDFLTTRDLTDFERNQMSLRFVGTIDDKEAPNG